MRALLTMLGIIIDVTSVIILVSLVNAYASYMTESLASLGTNQVTVSMTNMSSRSVPVDKMYEFFEENTDTLGHMTSQVTVSTTVKHGNDAMSSTSATRVSEDYLPIKDYQFQGGRNIQYSGIISRQKVCIIGCYVMTGLCGSPEEAIDQTTRIGGYAYQVVGVVEWRDGESQEDRRIDDLLWMPYSCATKMFRNANINNYTFTIQNLGKVSEVTELISDFLTEIFKDEDLSGVAVMNEMPDSLNLMIVMVSAGLDGTAGTFLLVADVGAINIMLASVTEWIRGIGVWRALGVKKGVTLRQLIIETTVQSSLGGAFGIMLGSVTVTTVGSLAGLNASSMSSAVVISFSVSVAVGLFFGYMPARWAAGLNPINVFRSEQDDKTAFLS